MINVKAILFFITFYIFLFHYEKLRAQEVESKLSSEEMSVTIDSVSNILEKNYVFPEVANKMVKRLIANLKNGKYSSLDDPTDFARQLTEDLQSISNDRHLGVIYNPHLIAAEQNMVSDEDKRAREDQRIIQMKRENFGF